MTASKQHTEINTRIPADMEVVDLTHTENRPTHNQISLSFNRGNYTVTIRNVELKIERGFESTSFMLDYTGMNYIRVWNANRFSAKTLESIRLKLEQHAAKISLHWNANGLDAMLRRMIQDWVGCQ